MLINRASPPALSSLLQQACEVLELCIVSFLSTFFFTFFSSSSFFSIFLSSPRPGAINQSFLLFLLPNPILCGRSTLTNILPAPCSIKQITISYQLQTTQTRFSHAPLTLHSAIHPTSIHLLGQNGKKIKHHNTF
ncbi:hypothetical protein K504DRAFT_52413 [Pleomassaria siparia CBS 279.74]|uniref:Uncharacterized protein n=1 Tax=Pleomassaria siparia CBS 279.74 TaxID=1314801 RepID=A0A6G1K2X4_9PLEO|nr:hypothetical protein K504DRAFT_52413 [Pleomassaria siparia CBS 279.74]